MSCSDTERGFDATRDPPWLWVIGYGNPQRRDDGIGPSVVARLRQALTPADGVCLVTLQQLEPDLVEDLQDARLLILVDASMEEVAGGWAWQRVEPDLGDVPVLTHHHGPAYFLGLVQAAWGQSPCTWLVSIQGEDFGVEEGLTDGAEKRAAFAAEEVLAFVEMSLRGRVMPEEVSGPIGATRSVQGAPCAGRAN